MRILFVVLLAFCAVLSTSGSTADLEDVIVTGQRLGYGPDGVANPDTLESWFLGDEWSDLNLEKFTEVPEGGDTLGVRCDLTVERMLLLTDERAPFAMHRLYRRNGKLAAQQVLIALDSTVDDVPAGWGGEFLSLFVDMLGQPQSMDGSYKGWDKSVNWKGTDGHPEVIVQFYFETCTVTWVWMSDLVEMGRERGLIQ